MDRARSARIGALLFGAPALLVAAFWVFGAKSSLEAGFSLLVPIAAGGAGWVLFWVFAPGGMPKGVFEFPHSFAFEDRERIEQALRIAHVRFRLQPIHMETWDRSAPSILLGLQVRAKDAERARLALDVLFGEPAAEAIAEGFSGPCPGCGAPVRGEAVCPSCELRLVPQPWTAPDVD